MGIKCKICDKQVFSQQDASNHVLECHKVPIRWLVVKNEVTSAQVQAKWANGDARTLTTIRKELEKKMPARLQYWTKIGGDLGYWRDVPTVVMTHEEYDKRFAYTKELKET